jgi:hypothetical protein
MKWGKVGHFGELEWWMGKIGEKDQEKEHF